MFCFFIQHRNLLNDALVLGLFIFICYPPNAYYYDMFVYNQYFVLFSFLSKMILIRMKRSLIILSHFLKVNTVDSFSPPFPELFDTAASSQGNLKARDSEIMPQSNGAEGLLADSTLSSSGPPTSLNNQVPQSPLDVPSIPFGIYQPSTSTDQTNPLNPSDSKTLALDAGDIPTIPSIPFIGGSGDMNYGPNIFQQIQQMWQHPFDVHTQPEPQCKPRKIPSGDQWGTEILSKMFAMCCGPVPKMTGPGSSNRLRVKWRRTECYICRY